MKLRILAVLAAAALIAAGLFVYTDKPLAPGVTLTTLQGERIDTAALRGKVVLINFWATTCTTCIAEMPMLIETHKKFAARGLETVAVAMDYDPEDQVRAYAERNALPFRVALDADGAVARGFEGVRLTPTTFLIDRRGHIVHKYLGAPDFDALHALLEKLVEEPA
ncbi:MAG: TlpA family protein disulfide reductase [Azoarcus sp.]|jgi:peroxiredoxin|nr:TlpA family protein disulfide reductase [Azoarcus sp.]